MTKDKKIQLLEDKCKEIERGRDKVISQYESLNEELTNTISLYKSKEEV